MMEAFSEGTGIQVIDDLQALQAYADENYDPDLRQAYIDTRVPPYIDLVNGLKHKQFLVDALLTLQHRPDGPENNWRLRQNQQLFSGAFKEWGYVFLPKVRAGSLILGFANVLEITRTDDTEDLKHSILHVPVRAIVSCAALDIES